MCVNTMVNLTLVRCLSLSYLSTQASSCRQRALSQCEAAMLRECCTTVARL
ncbi:hypothetical protein PF005_g3048 [Phytophthora fragariae]|uniref:Uncharacterized protein n=1 Tax=Phytophthora fragariae TaxID=53985 RepID=A0A6A3THT7_9STRA|nr:hypothetical protein PF003_g35679 [Phytophthora fragariae]KAE8947088.1 hypothetical protein PF009_g3298 [Phytophthora fragariae]KAE9026585.1 hypothetical protein PF011_g2475 [Phytophthora fragariae]KAE9133713.1 hypothetical protein PF010_g2715 [Phytophthora fragariae]KAE9134382.1 hypothetical protein PF007_g2953 [Phytophthora fragariae]